MTRGRCRIAALFWALGVVLTDPAFAAPSSPCDIRYPSDSTARFTCRKLGKGETLERLFGDAWIDVARFNRIDRRHASAGARVRVPDSLAAIRCFTPMPERLADQDSVPRLVLVNLSEQFLGAYERGQLVFSAPLASGGRATPTPAGEFRITRAHRDHRSSLYTIEGREQPYPMNWGLLFHVGADGVAYWIHGRDLPGVPASHGCIGLSDEAMQERCYGAPDEPKLADARRLYEWAVGDTTNAPHTAVFEPGIPMRVVGEAPGSVRGARVRLSAQHVGGDTLAVTGVQSRPLR